MKILIPSSVGGHLTEVLHLSPVLAGHDVSLVINDECQVPPYPFQTVWRIVHAERDWRLLGNFGEAARILLEERPDVILSTGASPAVPFAVLGKYLCGARVVFVETAAAVQALSLTGRLMRRVADAFFVQWPELARTVPEARYAPVVFG